MITKNEINSYKELKEKIESYSEFIARICYSTDPSYYRIAQDFKSLEIYDENVCVIFDGHSRGYYTEDLCFPVEYLSMTAEEIQKLENEKKEERNLKAQKVKEDKQKEEEEKQRKQYEELKKKFDH